MSAFSQNYLVDLAVSYCIRYPKHFIRVGVVNSYISAFRSKSISFTEMTDSSEILNGCVTWSDHIVSCVEQGRWYIHSGVPSESVSGGPKVLGRERLLPFPFLFTCYFHVCLRSQVN